MTRDEADELVRDLTAAGVEVRRVDELLDGSFAPYYHLPHPDYGGWIVHARLWRESVRAGWIEGIPRTALDRTPPSEP